MHAEIVNWMEGEEGERGGGEGRRGDGEMGRGRRGGGRRGGGDMLTYHIHIL